MMLKIPPVSRIVLAHYKRHLHNEKKGPSREYRYGTGQTPSEGQVRIILTALECQRGSIMRTLVCEGAWFLQQQGLPPFPWSRSLCPYRSLLGRILRDSFHIGVLRFHEAWGASYLLIHANVVIKHSMTDAVSLCCSVRFSTVSFRMSSFMVLYVEFLHTISPSALQKC